MGLDLDIGLDIGLDIVTGGGYSAGKAAYNAVNAIDKTGDTIEATGDAAEAAGKAAEQVGSSVAIMATTLQSVGEQLKSLLSEVEELLTIRRMSPRAEDELWEEEKERLADLEKELGEIIYLIPLARDPIESITLVIRLQIVIAQINEIFYQEPGILSECIYSAKETLERFNTLEQPRVENILDSVEDNLEVSEEILQEIKKLFVIKKAIPIPISDLSPALIQQADRLKNELEHCKDLYDRKYALAFQLKNVMGKVPEKRLDISDKWIKPVQELQVSPTNPEINIVETKILEKLNSLESSLGSIIETTKKTAFNGTEEHVQYTEPALKSESPVILSEKPSDKISEPKLESIKYNTIEEVKSSISKNSKITIGIKQPEAAKIAVGLNTKYDSFRKNFELINSHAAFTERRINKIDQEINLITHMFGEEPGLIPKTLEEVHGVLEHLRTEEQGRIDSVLDVLKKDLEETSYAIEHFRKEEQPRIDFMLDSINKNLEESEKTLSKVCNSLNSIQEGFLFFEKNAGIIKTSTLVLGGLVGLNLFFGLIVLVRTALGL